MKIKLSQNKIISPPVQKILKLLSIAPSNSKSIREISKETKLSYNTTYKIITSLEKDNHLHLQKMSTHVNCTLTKNQSTLLALSYINSIATSVFLDQNQTIKKIRTELISNPQIHLCLLFGSYAKGAARIDSDIDLLIITNEKKQISLLTSELSLKFNKTIDLHMYTPTEFENELQEKTQTVVKQALNTAIVLKGYEYYWQYAIKYKNKNSENLQ